MTRYLIAFVMLGLASLAYIILAFGARFDRTDELTIDGQSQGAIPDGIEGQGQIHFGSEI